MFPIRITKKKWKIHLLVAIFPFLLVTPIQAQTPQRDRNQFHKVIELTKLIQKAKEAGFSDDDIKNMQIKDGEQVINVVDYISKIENKKIFEQKKLNDFKKKRFLTMKDIFSELIKLEPDVLTRLREELIGEQ